MSLSSIGPRDRDPPPSHGGARVLNCGKYGILATPRTALTPPSVSDMQPVPDLVETAVAQAAVRFAQSSESPSVFNHSVRSYLFAELIAGRDGMRPGPD